jgi:hypothetical protein
VVAVPVTDAAIGHITATEDQVTKETFAEMTVEEAVKTYFSDIPVMIQIARCESTFRHTLEDGTVLRGKVDSADTGVMQINMRYHGGKARELGLDLTDIHDNMKYARNLYERQGTQPWSASAPCWSKTIAMK